MTFRLDGATRLHLIVGDPIAQVKSPGGVSQALAHAGRNAVCVPAHVAPADLATWFGGVSLMRNVDSIIVTVPHKFACRAFCATATERARFLGAVNTLRRNADGSWHGDMFDGQGCVSAVLTQAGGAGSAIAHALVLAGVSELAVHDPDQCRRDSLVTRLQDLQQATIRAGSSDPSGFDVIVNASPVGMREGDPLPIQADRLVASQAVGCVITSPSITPLIAAARATGCRTVTGADMFAQVRDLMLQFILEV